MELSRNDPCPCGSGKKFKKCCMETTPRAVATPTPPKSHALGLREHLEQGRFPELFTDDERFIALMEEAGRGVKANDPGEALEQLYERMAPQLWPQGLGLAVRRFEDEQQKATTDQDRAQWGAFAKNAAREDLITNTIARALFAVQAERLTKQISNVTRQLERLPSLTGGAEEKAAELMKLSDTAAGRDALQKTAVSVATTLANQVTRDRPLLAMDEWVWLAASVQPEVKRMNAAQSKDTAAEKALIDGLDRALDPALTSAVATRARTLATETPDDAVWYRSAAMALEVFPLPLITAAFSKLAVVCVTDLEAEDAFVEQLATTPDWKKDTLEPYRKFLVEQNQPAAAERVARAQGRL